MATGIVGPADAGVGVRVAMPKSIVDKVAAKRATRGIAQAAQRLEVRASPTRRYVASRRCMPCTRVTGGSFRLVGLVPTGFGGANARGQYLENFERYFRCLQYDFLERLATETQQL